MYRTSELRECGGMSVRVYLASIMICSVILSLDPNSDLHLFCLYYVFIPRINAHLEAWKVAWIKHPMRSEHNLTPEQLWTAGLNSIAGSSSRIASEVIDNMTEVKRKYYHKYLSNIMHHN